MKKSIKTFFVITAIAVSTLNASAVKPSYRGFTECGITYGSFPSDYAKALSVHNSYYNEYEGEACSAFNFATSHGVQLNRMFFVGAGIGVNNIIKHDGNTDDYDVPDYFAQFAIFLDGRWDMNLTKKVSPFFDLRLGIATNFDTDDFNIFQSNPYKVGEETTTQWQWQGFNQQPCNQFYFQPTIGVRFRLHHHLGLNIGLTYFTRKRVDVIFDHTTITDIKTMYKNQFGIIIGLDF